jgi:hypothetical protein
MSAQVPSASSEFIEAVEWILVSLSAGVNMPTTKKQTVSKSSAAAIPRAKAKSRAMATQKSASSAPAKRVFQDKTKETNKRNTSAKRRQSKKETRAFVAVAIELLSSSNAACSTPG